MDLHGFDVEPIGASKSIGGIKLRFWAVNHRPPVGLTGELLDTAKVGLNSTVEVFEHVRGTDKLQWVRTYANEQIRTPNRVAATGNNGFVMTNDQSTKAGARRLFDPLIGGGNLIHCGPSTCQPAIPGTLVYPNGLTRNHHDGLYYVPSSVSGIVHVYSLNAKNTLTWVEKIPLGMPLDNLSVDSNGDIYAAGFPKMLAMMQGFDDPVNSRAPSTVIRARKTASGWKVEKVIEDRDGEVLPAATSVVHDVKTGRLFLGGVFSPFITVCEPKK